MTIDLSNIDELLLQDIGETGTEYLMPQLQIIRSARNLPKNIEECRLESERFFESLELIEEWINPLTLLLKAPSLEEKEEVLRQLQSKASFLLREEGITSWVQAMKSEKEEIPSLLEQIQTIRNDILQLRQEILDKTRRQKISLLFGLVYYPYSRHETLAEAIHDVEKNYFGPNTFFHKKNKYTDALLLTHLALDSLKKKKSVKKFDETIKELLRKPEMDEIRRAYELAIAHPSTEDLQYGFTERNLVYLTSNILNRRLTPAERSDLNEFYDSARDRYHVLNSFDWFTTRLFTEDTQETKITRSSTTPHLLGLSFMDKHKNNEIIGNVPVSSFDLFESVLAPFNELKQDSCFMQSAQFEIQAMGLPEQAWIYDYSATKTEILRSTLLLISDKQPKFDMLEACQRLCTAVLSGRVDRNDMRYPESNYIQTDLLPKNPWNYIANSLIEVLEEALVYEEGLSQRIVRQIFAEEDRSHLVTSRKFMPVFQVELDFKRRSRTAELPSPEEISIYAHKSHEFQYRHALASGYPWYYGLGSALEKLVADAFKISQAQLRSLKGNVQLRQVVHKIEENDRERFYVLYYQNIPETDNLSIMAFRETELGQEGGISPVEVIFRPHKWIERGPKRNNLELILEKARATDPKDLQTIISSL
ncbi:MAG: hypothetical protein ACFFD4_13230 [Candidatus Odinarchaeota archaeon]